MIPNNKPNASERATEKRGPHSRARRQRQTRPAPLMLPKWPGQAAILVVLAMLVLIPMLGLAIDGGSMYAQRRTAQNSSDATSLAATQRMLQRYEVMVQDPANQGQDVGGSSSDEQYITDALTTYAAAHGIQGSDLHALYVNDDKQIVSNVEIGSLGIVPWASLGAKGISVTNRSQTDAYFMKLLGWNKV